MKFFIKVFLCLLRNTVVNENIILIHIDVSETSIEHKVIEIYGIWKSYYDFMEMKFADIAVFYLQ